METGTIRWWFAKQYNLSFDGNFEKLRSSLPDSTSGNFWNRGVLASYLLKKRYTCKSFDYRECSRPGS